MLSQWNKNITTNCKNPLLCKYQAEICFIRVLLWSMNTTSSWKLSWYPSTAQNDWKFTNMNNTISPNLHVKIIYTFCSCEQFCISAAFLEVLTDSSLEITCKTHEIHKIKYDCRQALTSKHYPHTPVPLQGASSKILSAVFWPKTLGSWNDSQTRF